MFTTVVILDVNGKPPIIKPLSEIMREMILNYFSDLRLLSCITILQSSPFLIWSHLHLLPTVHQWELQVSLVWIVIMSFWWTMENKHSCLPSLCLQAFLHSHFSPPSLSLSLSGEAQIALLGDSEGLVVKIFHLVLSYSRSGSQYEENRSIVHW